MKRSFLIMGLALTLLIGCGRKPQRVTPPSSPPIVLDAPIDFTVGQRSTTALPGSNGKVLLTTGDITKGQVMTTLSWDNGAPIVAARSLHENDAVTFTAGDHVYKIKLEKLTNVLVGEDSAAFQLWPATAEPGEAPSEDEKIEALIGSLEQLDGATFIRNDQEHTLDEAVAHMRRKWDWKESEIETAEDFIRIAASKSSTTGKPYIIRMPDGTETKAGDWFRTQLELMDASPPAGAAE